MQTINQERINLLQLTPPGGLFAISHNREPPFLLKILNVCLKTGLLLKSWNKTIINLTPKKVRKFPSSYCLIWVWENFMKNHTSSPLPIFLTYRNWFSDKQFSFRSRRHDQQDLLNLQTDKLLLSGY